MNSEEQARLGLERYLQGRFSDAQWDYLVEQGYAEDFVVGEAAVEDVGRQIKRMFHILGGGPAGREANRGEMLSDKGRREPQDAREERRLAVSVLLAAEAAKDEAVIGFRESVLGGKLLPWEEIGRWIERQTELDGEPTQYVEVPLAAGTAVRRDSIREACVFDPPLVLESIPGTTGARTSVKVLKYGTPQQDQMQRVPTAVEGALDRLRKTSDRLGKLHGWTADQATVFVLTGITPLVALVRVERRVNSPFSVTSRIVLTVDPTVTPEELADRYRRVRQQMREGRHRPQTQKHMRLAMFAARRPSDEPWREALRAWNEENREQHPDWVYGLQQEVNFCRDVDSSRSRLLSPPYLDPVPRMGSSDQPGSEGRSIVSWSSSRSEEAPS